MRPLRMFGFLLLLLSAPAAAQSAPADTSPGDSLVVLAQEAPGAVRISATETSVIVVDKNDVQPTGIAAGLLAADIGRVTGRTAEVVNSLAKIRRGSDAVIAGTLGHSALIDQIVREQKIDISAIQGKWESYLILTVEKPAANIRRALVIIGSDRRGTAYGALTVSKAIGVSPWYWWADVPVVHRDTLYIAPGRYSDGSPAVKYRGIFINDEAPAMSGWTKEKFGGFNSKMYVHVFELLLRLKANYLWPAMWGSAFNEDDPASPKLANDYGIVMGTSHQEPMLRAQGEFDHRFKPEEWNYATQPQLMEKFWREGIARNRNFESIITMGLRGRNDTEMIPGATVEQSAALLEKIVTEQRKILAAEMNPDVTRIPQLWCLYKEVQEYYAHGLRVPDDITLLWSDDNWGNIRRLPTAEERKRAGGAGIYYHFDYVGGPRNYRWINTNTIGKTWQQMTMAHRFGANRIWIVNVGDIKPMELPIDFFLTMAWNPDAMTAQKQQRFTRDWMTAAFGPAHAEELTALYNAYTAMNGRRKPELLNTDPDGIYSENYDEAARVLTEARTMRQKAEVLAGKLPPEQQDAYFELIGHPVTATAIVNALYIEAARNQRLAKQNDPAANDAAAEVHKLFAEDAALSARYNHDLAGGKWNHMMDQVHLGYTKWFDPPANQLPPLASVSGGKTHQSTAKPASGMQGVIAIDAAQFATRSDGLMRWQVIDGDGRTEKAITALPDDPDHLPDVATLEGAPALQYHLKASGKVTVHVDAAPTIASMPGRGQRYAIAFDNEKPQIIDLAADHSQSAWEKGVSDNRHSGISRHVLKAGEHTLTIRAVDPGIMLDKIVIDMGGLKPSYLGPPSRPAAP